MNLKIEIWSLVCMDLQKEQETNAHGSGWMLVICKHWNWNWHWDWKYSIFLTKGGDIVWMTASIKLGDLLITWSRDKCKALYLLFRNTYGPQNWQSSNLWWGEPTFKVLWPFNHVVIWQIQTVYICTSAISMATKLGRVVTWGGGGQSSKSRELLITRSHDK